MTKEQIYSYKDISVNYIFESSKQDRRHLLVVFSGFSVDYELRGESYKGCRSNILWIKDHFCNDYAYYLCVNNDFSVESAVVGLIEKYRQELSLSKTQCTLMGFSKGGSAALYYGLTYDYKNIISSCPQIKIGSYLNSHWKRPAKHIMGKDYSLDDICRFDNLIPALLKSKSVIDKNIYLISSKNDAQYDDQIKPFVDCFSRCGNFNFICTSSMLAWQHNKVTRYNIPVILSIVYAHGEGIYPYFGDGVHSNGVSHYDAANSAVVLEKQRSSLTPVSVLHKVRMVDGVLFPEGHSIIKGYECAKYNQISQKFIISNSEASLTAILGKVINEELSYLYFENVFCDYRAGGFTSFHNDGIDLSNLDLGVYSLGVRTGCGNVVVENTLVSDKRITLQNVVKNKLFSLYSVSDKVFLSVSKLVDNNSQVFEVKEKWIRDGFLHYEGVFAVKGVFVREWGECTYYITLRSNVDFVFKLGICHFDYLNDVFLDHKGEYAKSYFRSISKKGVDIRSLPVGTYKLFISMNKSGALFTKEIDDCIVVTDEGQSIK